MAVLTCKMCCAPLEILQDGKFAKCSYCGTLYTLPLDGDDETSAMIKATPILEMGRLFLKDGRFDLAAECFDKVIVLLPQYGEAYLGRGMAHFKVRNLESMRGVRSIRAAALKNFYIIQALNYCKEPLISQLRSVLELHSENDWELIVIHWRKKAQDIRKDMVQELKKRIRNENPEYGKQFKEINDQYNLKIKAHREDVEKTEERILHTKERQSDNYTQLSNVMGLLETLERQKQGTLQAIEDLKNQQSLEINQLKEKYPDHSDYVSYADYQELTQKYPLPALHQVKEESILDKVYDILLSDYRFQSESDIASNPLCEGLNSKRIVAAIRKLVYEKRAIVIEKEDGTFYAPNDMGDVLIKY